jgi:hypothetical protein
MILETQIPKGYSQQGVPLGSAWTSWVGLSPTPSAID